jgi:ribonuclease BN (tRNA processing enzyme)
MQGRNRKKQTTRPVTGVADTLTRGTQTRVVLLGTGAGSVHYKARMPSSAVIVVNKVPYVIDCGDGVSRQLVLADVPLHTLRYIFITHHHADHNLDYGNLIYNAWASAWKGQVDAYGPAPLARITELFLEMNSYDINLRITDQGRQPIAPMIRVHELDAEGLVMQDENVRVTATLVNHPPVNPAFAYRFDTPDRSIVFSGDTAPCESLIQLAQGADVLVQDSVHTPAVARMCAPLPDPEKLQRHIIHGHTTTVEAGEIARAARVKTLVLSYLTPADDPLLTDEMWIEGARTHFDGTILVARDLLEI